LRRASRLAAAAPSPSTAAGSGADTTAGSGAGGGSSRTSTFSWRPAVFRFAYSCSRSFRRVRSGVAMKIVE
jgi:hypothetical protein